MNKILAGTLIIVAGVFMLSASSVMAQEPCESDFTCDGDVDADDVEKFLEDFGRFQFNNPCPDCYDSPCPCNSCPYGMIDCGGKCVDPMTDEAYCGVNEECLGGTFCGAGESCEGGICMLNCPPGLIECSGQCVNPDTDEQYCGASGDCLGGSSGTLCVAGEICASAVCILNCPSGLAECAGTCVDTTTDESNCGDCGIPCGSGEVCLGGNCELFCSDNYAPVPKTGQTTSYSPGDDGELLKGVAWPNPRFTDNLDGTVTDNLTGLIWLKNANCFGLRTWNEGLSDCNGLASGSCGLTDGSIAGNWRLPNVFELRSLSDLKYWEPTLSNSEGTGQWTHGDPFTNLLVNGYYWSSSTLAYGTGYAWLVGMDTGYVGYSLKTSGYYVWPVRGGQ
jgi:hypothetical protein